MNAESAKAYAASPGFYSLSCETYSATELR